jgi:O-antigen/teichoic acid export membrane protein
MNSEAQTTAGLKHSAIGAAWWTGAQNVLDEGLRFAFFLVLARLLTPTVFGLMALAGVYLAVVNLFVEQGLAKALVQREALRADHLDTAFWCQLLLALLFFALGFALAGPIAAGLDQPALAPVLQTLALLTPLSALNAVQVAQLERGFRARRIGVAKLAGTLGGGAAGVALALGGFGIWSLVAQQIVSMGLNVALVWSAGAWRPGTQLRLSALRELAAFSGGLFGVSALKLLKRQGDRLLVGVLLGPAALGVFSTAQRLIETITQVVVRPVSQLGLPVLSRMQGQTSALASAWRKMLQATVVAAFPICGVLFVLAPEIVALVLGPQWQSLTPALRILALLGAVQAVSMMNSALLLACGESLLRLRLNAVYLVVALALSAVSVRFGVEAVCAAAALAALAFLPFESRAVARLLGLPVRALLMPLTAAGLATLAMGAAMGLVKTLSIAGTGALPTAALALLAGAVVYSIVLHLVDPGLLALLREFVSHRPRRRMPAPSHPGPVATRSELER